MAAVDPARFTRVFFVVMLVGISAYYLVLRPRLIEPRGANHPGVGRAIDYVALEPLDEVGLPLELSDLQGKVVLMNFWATWCGPCRIEMPAMEQLYRSFSRKDFEILAVSTDPQGAAVTRPFQQEMGFTFPVLHDADFRIGLRYGARTLPMTFLIDQRGIIRKRIFGARDWNTPEGRRLVQSLMGAS